MKCENCTCDEFKFYIQLVIVQLCCSSSRKNKVFNVRKYDIFVIQCRVGMAHGKLLVISKKKQSLPKDCVPHRLESKLGESEARAPNQA